MLSGHVWINKYPEATHGSLIVKLFHVYLSCDALLIPYVVLPVISLTVLNTSSWESSIFGVLVNGSLQIMIMYMFYIIVNGKRSFIAVDKVGIHRHTGCNAVYCP